MKEERDGADAKEERESATLWRCGMASRERARWGGRGWTLSKSLSKTGCATTDERKRRRAREANLGTINMCTIPRALERGNLTAATDGGDIHRVEVARFRRL